MKIIYRILVIAAVPLVAYLMATGVYLQQVLSERSIFQEMETNVALLDVGSKLIEVLQQERAAIAEGKTTSSDGDVFVEQFYSCIDRSTLKDKFYTRQKFMSSLAGLRIADQGMRDKTLSGFSALISDVMSLIGNISNTKTTKGLGKVFVSIFIMESARERASNLQIAGADNLRNDQPIEPVDASLLMQMKAEMDAGVTSPAITLSEESKKKKAFAVTTPAWKLSEEALKRLILRAAVGKFGISELEYKGAMGQKVRDLSEILHNEHSILKNRLTTERDKSNEEITRILIGVVCITVLIVSACIYMALRIRRQMRLVALSLRGIAHGEGDLTVRLQEGTDELGEVARHFNEFVEHILEIVKEVKYRSGTLSGASREIFASANTVLEGAETASEKSLSAATSSSQMSSNIALAADSIEQTSSNLQCVASAAEEMSATSASIADRASQATDVSSRAAAQTTEMTKIMAKLGEAAQEIGIVTDTISQISSQTTLLALNATIEAARAGTAGRGFAVVANEIKELANQAASATHQIQERVQNIQSAAETFEAEVFKMTNVTSEVGELVDLIARAVIEQNAATSEMAQNLGGASLGASEAHRLVSENKTVAKGLALDIAQIMGLADGQTTVSKNLEFQTQTIATQAAELQTLVARFKTEGV